MKERPILFSAPMVRALLAGTKTQTRRVVKPVRHPDFGNIYSPGALAQEPRQVIERACPYGQPGDRLWVRETFFAFGRWVTQFNAKKGRDEWHFIDMTLESGKAYGYPGDFIPHDFRKGNQRNSITPTWWKRPAIFMPRAASRTTLEITGVRVERLQDISHKDAIAEGVAHVEGAGLRNERLTVPQHIYAHLWEQINGPGSWEANPWVWVVEFKKIAKEQP